MDRMGNNTAAAEKERIALYLRLSLADGDIRKGGSHKDESNSIENQRLLLQTYVAEHPLLSGEVCEYVDDGYTGTNFNRQGFQRMVTDAQKGRIQTILVKDLSRLGRDYIGVGDYIEQIFPVLGVRFIAVNNNFDSGLTPGQDSKDALGIRDSSDHGIPTADRGLELAVNNLVNNFYSRDISKKVRSANDTRWKQGQATVTNVPFGYDYDRKNKKWVIDPVSSKYVRRIFDLALEGMRSGQIALRLNEEHIPTAAAYNLETNRWGVGGYKAPEAEQLWDYQKVWRILKRYEYTGALVMAKRRRYILGSRSTRMTPDKDRIVVEGNHEAIVTHEEFEAAQAVIRGMKEKEYKIPTEYPLKGKVCCGNCKKQLRFTEIVGGNIFYCAHKRQAGRRSKCCADNYSEAAVNASVAYAIRQMLGVVGFLNGDMATVDEDRKAVNGGLHQSKVTVSQLDEDKVKSEMEILKAERIRQYEGYADGIISREEYIRQKKTLTEKIEKIQAQLEAVEASRQEESRCADAMQEIAETGEAVSRDKNGAYIGGLTREKVNAFVEQVYVYNKERIEVVFKCEDAIKEALDKLREQSIE